MAPADQPFVIARHLSAGHSNTGLDDARRVAASSPLSQQLPFLPRVENGSDIIVPGWALHSLLLPGCHTANSLDANFSTLAAVLTDSAMRRVIEFYHANTSLFAVPRRSLHEALTVLAADLQKLDASSRQPLELHDGDLETLFEFHERRPLQPAGAPAPSAAPAAHPQASRALRGRSRPPAPPPAATPAMAAPGSDTAGLSGYDGPAELEPLASLPFKRWVQLAEPLPLKDLTNRRQPRARRCTPWQPNRWS